ncbi:MAG: NAD-dependent epimerase/dehydratase family protein [Sarcina sp.]
MDKVIVTGATGFIGSNLVKRLVFEGYKVAIVIREKSSLKNLEEVLDEIEIFIFDNNLEKLISFLEKTNPKVIFHLASLFIGDHQSKDIENLIDSNVKFGCFLLEAMKKSSVNNIINTGTAWQHFNNEKYNASCLYAATKESFSKILEYYVKAYSMKAITLELFDSYGENDNRGKLINIIEKAAFSKEELDMSWGEQYIDLTHVDDIVEGFLIAYKHLLKNINEADLKVYGLCTGRRLTIRDVVQLFEDILGYKLKINWGKREYRKREIMIPWNSYEKLPNWNSKISLEEGLRRVVKQRKNT